MSESNKGVTFVLTGPREGFTGVLGGRYGFKDGELTVDLKMKDGLKNILCRAYCCNIKGDAPMWKTVKDEKTGKKASVAVSPVKTEQPKETTTVKSEPTASVKVPDKKVS